MPWRLIVFIVVLGIFLAFIGFNLENRCDVSFGFTEFSNVPVFFTVFTSFVLGLFCTLPFIFTAGRRHRLKEEKEKAAKEKMAKEKIEALDEASPRGRAGNPPKSGGFDDAA